MSRWLQSRIRPFSRGRDTCPEVRGSVNSRKGATRVDPAHPRSTHHREPGTEEICMRFLMMVMSDARHEAGGPLPPELLAEIGRHSEDLMKRGVLLASEGL